MIRFLNQSDIQECTRIAALKNRTAGTVPITPGGFITAFEKYFQQTEHYYSIGYFENDILISFVCISMFENKLRGKFWVIPALYTKSFKNYFRFNKSGIGELIKFAFDFAESKEYYEYYYCTAERVMNVYERQWKRSNQNRYEHILLDIVPAYTKPFHELYWRLMGNEVKPDPIVFKKRVLKKEYRKS